MKQKLRLMMTMLLLAVMGGSWANTSSVTASKVTSSSMTWTGSANESWTVNVNSGATNQNVVNDYAQIGTKNSPSKSVTFSTSGITGTITSIEVDCASYGGLASVNATVGGQTFGTQGQSTPSWSNNNGGIVTFSGSASGAIVITMTNGSSGRAMYIKSIEVTYSNGGQVVVNSPTFSPDATITYNTPQSVELSCTTSGATIYYTTDGSDPKESNTVSNYSNPISISKTTTINAYAEKDGVQSDVVDAKYTLKVANPYINSDNAPTLSLHCSGTPGATIYYTTDGTDPSSSDTRIEYNAPFTLNKTTTLKACAEYGDMERSETVEKIVTLKTSNPTFSPTAGTYSSEQSVTISCENEGAIIYYTTDGSDPTTSSAVYSDAITVSQTTTIKAFAKYGEYDESEIVSATYTIREISGDAFVKMTSIDELAEGIEVIIVNEEASKTMGEQQENNFYTVDVVFNVETAIPDEGATIMTLEKSGNYWCLKTSNGYLYAASSNKNYLKTESEIDENAKAAISFDDYGNATIQFQGDNTRNLLRYNPNTSGSPLFSCYSSGQQPVQIYYRSSASSVVAPTITPETGTYTDPQTVTITNNAEGTTVYYTVDGTTPISESSEFTAPFQLGKNGTYVVKAISIGDDGSSNVTTSTITINITVAVPVFDKTDGMSFDAPYTIQLSAGEGTTIYYTTNNTSPIDANGNLTSDAVVYNSTTGIANLNKAITINAVAIDRFGNVSEISTASYYYEGEVTLPYYENFDQGLGNFTTESSSNVKWEFQTNHNVEVYGEERKYAFITGGNYTTKSQYAGEDRLISPVFDLTNNENVTMSFIHTGHWFSNSQTGGDGSDGEEALMKASCHLQIRTVGDNGYSNWVDISDRIKTWFTQRYRIDNNNYKGMFDRVNSGDINLSDYKGQKVQICFYFTTTSSTSGTWNVLKFAVTGTEAEKENYEEVPMSTNGYITYVVKNDIDWKKTLARNKSNVDVDVHGFKVIQFTERANEINGEAVLVEFGFDKQLPVSEDCERNLNEDQMKSLWSEMIIPAGTPIILKGQGGQGVVNKLVIAKHDDVISSVKGNLLKPSFGDVTGAVGQTLYVLQKTDDWDVSDPYKNYLFYKLTKGRTIPDRKAYLNAADASDEIIYELVPDSYSEDPSIQHVAPFRIITDVDTSPMVSDDAGIPDGIETVNEEGCLNENVFYSISGMKVTNPSKGVYILNGKKILIK